MDKSAVVLAIEYSDAFNEDKGLLMLNDKPLLLHTVEAVEDIVDEVIIVTSTQKQADAYKELTTDARLVVAQSNDVLSAALTGFEAAQNKYSLLLPFDAPFVSAEITILLFDLCKGKSAVVTRTPDNEIEPLQAVYETKLALEAGKRALLSGEASLDGLVRNLKGVRYVSTLVIEQLDPDFRTFFRVKTPIDLKKAIMMSKPRMQRAKKS